MSKRGSIESRLASLYYTASDPASYGSVERLFRRARELRIGGNKLTRKRVEAFLRGEQAYTLHRRVRKRFARNKTYVARVDQQWQADLADMQQLAEKNNGYKYLLTCIDVLSKFAWVVPVKSKDAKHILAAWRTLLRRARPRKPQRLQTDKGKEFFNQDVSGFLKEQGIHHFASQSDQKAAVVERFNRTIKSRIWKYFTANKTTRYIDVLQDFVDSYNNTVHRSIGMRPKEVRENDDSELVAWKRLFYPPANRKTNWQKRRVQDDALVRVSKWKGDFEKGYVPGWSREHFRVRGALSGLPRVVYKLEDAAGEPIEGGWYQEEIQPIAKNVYEVERIIGERKTPRVGQEVLVKWIGLPEKFNRWIRKQDLPSYQKPTASRWQLYDKAAAK
jgi:transposase InsO family protein